MGLGFRIQKCLTEKNWSQSDLLKRVPGLERANLSAIIRRDAERSSFALAIARGLGCESKWLLDGSGAQWPTDSIREQSSVYQSSGDEFNTSIDQEQHCLDLFRQLPAPEKQRVLMFMQERIGFCEQLMNDMLMLKGLDVVSKEDGAG